MAKKKWVILILFFLVFLIGFFLVNLSKRNTPNIQLKKTAASVTPAPAPSPTPQPIINLPRVQGTFGVPILTYHYIANNPNSQDVARDSLEVPPDKFEEQMQYLSSNGYTPISLDTLFAIFSKTAPSPAKPIVLTFDDGYIDFYTTVYPILQRFNFHAVSFIPTGLIGGGYYMNWDQIRKIQSSGLVTFEDHTITHANLTALSYTDALKQMVDSKNILQAQTGYPVNFIAYPYGISNNSVQAAAHAAGFVGGLGTWYGKADAIYLNMPRIKVSGFWTIQDFAARL